MCTKVINNILHRSSNPESVSLWLLSSHKLKADEEGWPRFKDHACIAVCSHSPYGARFSAATLTEKCITRVLLAFHAHVFVLDHVHMLKALYLIYNVLSVNVYGITQSFNSSLTGWLRWSLIICQWYSTSTIMTRNKCVNWNCAWQQCGTAILSIMINPGTKKMRIQWMALLHLHSSLAKISAVIVSIYNRKLTWIIKIQSVQEDCHAIYTAAFHCSQQMLNNLKKEVNTFCLLMTIDEGGKMLAWLSWHVSIVCKKIINSISKQFYPTVHSHKYKKIACIVYTSDQETRIFCELTCRKLCKAIIRGKLWCALVWKHKCYQHTRSHQDCRIVRCMPSTHSTKLNDKLKLWSAKMLENNTVVQLCLKLEIECFFTVRPKQTIQTTKPLLLE